MFREGFFPKWNREEMNIVDAEHSRDFRSYKAEYEHRAIQFFTIFNSGRISAYNLFRGKHEHRIQRLDVPVTAFPWRASAISECLAPSEVNKILVSIFDESKSSELGIFRGI